MTSSDVALIRSIRPPRSRELVRAVAINAPRHGRVARKRSLCAIAIVFASLFHYDGVWRVPYPIRPDCPSAFSPPRAHVLSSSPHALLPSPPQLLFLFFSSPSFDLLLFSAIFPPLSTKRERERRLRPSRCIRVPPRRRRMSSLVPRFQARARVHIAVTMMCVILRRLANVNPRRCDEEGEQAGGEERKRGK